MTVQPKVVNVRAGKGTEHPVVAKLKQGQSVEVETSGGGWSQITVPGSEERGWVRSDLLRRPPEGDGECVMPSFTANYLEDLMGKSGVDARVTADGFDRITIRMYSSTDAAALIAQTRAQVATGEEGNLVDYGRQSCVRFIRVEGPTGEGESFPTGRSW